MTTYYERVLAEVRERRDKTAEIILSGQITGPDATTAWAEYRAAIGRLNGLSLAEAILVETYKNMNQTQPIEQPKPAGAKETY